MPTYNIIASALPVPIAVTTPALGTPSTPFTTAQSYPPPGTSTLFNQAAAALKIITGAGAGCYGVLTGLALSDAGGLNVSVGLGVAIVDGILEIVASGAVGELPFKQVNQPAAYTLADNATNYVWLTQTGALVAATTLGYPAGAKIFLGTVVTLAGAITSIDSSGVITISGGRAYRRTADYDAPTDSPAASLTIFTRTASGMWIWDGVAHRFLGRATANQLMRTGALAETMARDMVAGDSGAILTSGQAYMVAISIEKPTVVTSITFMTGTTAFGTPTHCFFALYTSALALLSQTADQLTAAWPANTEKTLALAAPQTLQSGLYYLQIVCVGAVMPSLMSASLNALVTALAPVRCGTSTGALTTTAPGTAGAITATAKAPYAWVS